MCFGSRAVSTPTIILSSPAVILHALYYTYYKVKDLVIQCKIKKIKKNSLDFGFRCFHSANNANTRCAHRVKVSPLSNDFCTGTGELRDIDAQKQNIGLLTFTDFDYC